MFKKNGRSGRGVNFVWPLAGGYLVYLGGKLLWMCYRGESSNMVLSTLAGIAFMVLGGLVILREWHIYRGGNAPTDTEDALPEETETAEDEAYTENEACAEEDEA